MPNIYIDASFFEDHESSENLDVSYTTSDSNLIGVYNLRTDLRFYDTYNLKPHNGLNNEVVISLLDLSEGNVNLDVDLYRNHSTVRLLDIPSVFSSYTIKTLSSGSVDSILDYFAGYISSPSGTGINYFVEYVGGEHFITSYNYLYEYWVFPSISGSINSDVAYMNYTGTLCPSGIPIDYYYGDINRYLEYGIGSGTSSLMNYPVDLFFAGWIRHLLKTDCISSLLNTRTFYIDSELETGGKEGYYLGCHSTNLRERHAVDFDIFSTLVDYYELSSELETISGTKQCLYNDVFSVYHSDFGCKLDIDLFTIYFDNFNIDRGDYASIDSTVCVDAYDSVYGLVTSGTYFKINDSVVSGSINEINNGYRICFNVQDNLNLFSGITKITAVAENNNNDILEEDYYLTSGYIVDFNNTKRYGVDFGFGNKVYVRMEAENLASCPEVTTDGYYFISRVESNSDLSAYVFPVGSYYSDEGDLTASIYPNSTAYFYDKEFEVVIRVKDYAGNEMEPHVINFKIHNPDE